MSSYRRSASQRWKWAIRRVLFTNLQAKIIRRMFTCPSSLSSSRETVSGRNQITLSSFDTCDDSATAHIDSPVKVKPTSSAQDEKRRKSSSRDDMFFSASRFRHLF